MAKGSGGTRKSTSDNPKGLSVYPLAPASILADRKTFYGYGPEWEHTYFDEQTGGFLVTDLARKNKPMTKNDKDTFMKEQRMGMKFASFGFQIEHLNELPGISSPDVSIRRHGSGAIVVNGRLADFKSTKSANNIVRYATKAVEKQGADIVMFEFTRHAKGIADKLDAISSKGIHGYYYYSDEKKYRSF